MDDAFQLFKYDIEGSNLEIMIDAANKLTIVAVAIGPKRVITELIPYLPKLMTIPNDEVLAAVGRQLFNIYDIAGGSEALGEDGIRILFACLRQLSEEEEITVRMSAVSSIQKMSPSLTHADIASHLLPLFRGLSGNDLFGARHTAAYILDVVYKYTTTTDRELLRQSLIALAQDEAPMVRRVVAKVLPSFCSVITQLVQQSIQSGNLPPEQISTDITHSHELIRSTVIPIIQQLSIDERDYLRDLTALAITGIIPHIPLRDFQTYLTPLIKGLADDLSWKVRQRISEQCPAIAINLIKRALHQINTESKYLYPSNPTEVTQANQAITNTGGKYDINKLVGFIFTVYKRLLFNDNNLEVRSVGILNLADMIFLSKGVIPADFNPDQPRQPVFTAQATEEDSLNLQHQFVSSLPPHLRPPTYTPPSPATTLFTIDQSVACEDFGNGLQDLARELSALSKVDLCEAFAQIAQFVGFPYTNRYILPVINILAQDDHVQVRSTVILCLEPIFATCPAEVIISHVWPILEALHLDIRWRVRRAVATQVSAICHYLKEGHSAFIEESVVPLIESLLSENVHAVRNRTAVEFRSLVCTLGEATITKHFLPLCVDLFNPKANYLHRITALHFIYFCSIAYDNACSKNTISEHFTPFFVEALNDQVPNVRILAIRYILALLQVGGVWTPSFVAQTFAPVFKTMSNDHDREVQLQGTLALEVVNNLK